MPNNFKFPLQISANRRYLVDQNGQPFLIHGEAAWSLISALTKEEAEEYLLNRRQKGVNTILVNLVEHYYNGPQNRYGDKPFRNPEDFSTINESYFDHADWVIAKAAQYGIQILLAPLYLGAVEHEGWICETRQNGLAKCHQYGHFVGERYSSYENIIWVMGGDRNPGDVLQHVNMLAYGIKEFDERHLFTAHCSGEASPAVQYAGCDWLDLNNTYTGRTVYRALLRDYQIEPTTPFFLIESNYEGEHNASSAQIRRQAYWSVLCGGAGQVFGNRPIWLFDPGWREALESDGSQSMVHLKTLFDSRPWFNLVPQTLLNGRDHFWDEIYYDRDDLVITDGLGEFIGENFLTAARTPDGGVTIAYMPNARTVTVNLSKISGQQARIWWYDPRTGTPTLQGNFPSCDSQRLTPPSAGDWILVIENADLNLPIPNSSSSK